MSATTARLPAAITIWSAVICLPVPVSRVWSSTNVAWPSWRSTFGNLLR
jgi:hypothetical protein